jgi:hypothetical protein
VLNPEDNSLLELNVAPDQEQTSVYMHCFIVQGGSYIECCNSPMKIAVVLSELHKAKLQ